MYNEALTLGTRCCMYGILPVMHSYYAQWARRILLYNEDVGAYRIIFGDATAERSTTSSPRDPDGSTTAGYFAPRVCTSSHLLSPCASPLIRDTAAPAERAHGRATSRACALSCRQGCTRLLPSGTQAALQLSAEGTMPTKTISVQSGSSTITERSFFGG